MDRETAEIPSSTIVLHFFRHGDKEQRIEGQPDQLVPLTPVGREQAIATSLGSDLSRSVAFGSPRERTQQTAALVMAGQTDVVSGDESLEELVGKLNLGNKASKIRVDERLDFYVDSTTEFGKRQSQATKDGRLLQFFVEESDTLAETLNDPNADTYSRVAARLGGIVQKYISTAPRLRQTENVAGINAGNRFDRFFGTHQGVSELFLAKVIELTKGNEARDSFVASLDNQGFDFVEGFNVEIVTRQGMSPSIRVMFNKEKEGKPVFNFDEIMPNELIDSIVGQTAA